MHILKRYKQLYTQRGGHRYELYFAFIDKFISSRNFNYFDLFNHQNAVGIQTQH